MESAHLLPWFGHFLATIVALVSTPETVGWSFELLYRSFEASDLVYDSSMYTLLVKGTNNPFLGSGV